MSWWDDDERLTPSRAELDREAHEDLMAATYEVRYQEFCRAYHLDPEDGRSVEFYEEEWDYQTHEGLGP